MRLPTIAFVVAAAHQAARRFPLVVGAGCVAAYAALGLVHNSGDTAPYIRLLTAATLGFPLLFALTILAERRARTAGTRFAMLAVGVLVLVLFWTAWPGWSDPVQAFRYAQLSAAFHLMVAFLPYARYAEPNGFWQHNRALFLRFLTAALYSGVLYLGLAVALLAVDKLLGVHVPGEGYARLWIVIAFVFNTWFFVGGVPGDLLGAALRSLGDVVVVTDKEPHDYLLDGVVMCAPSADHCDRDTVALRWSEPLNADIAAQTISLFMKRAGSLSPAQDSALATTLGSLPNATISNLGYG
jgi:hypothetical protein